MPLHTANPADRSHGDGAQEDDHAGQREPLLNNGIALVEQLEAARIRLDRRTEELNCILDWRDDLLERHWRAQIRFELVDSGDDAIAALAAEVAAFKRIVRALAWGRAA